MAVYLAKTQVIHLEMNNVNFEDKVSMESICTTLDTEEERLGKLEDRLEDIT